MQGCLQLLVHSILPHVYSSELVNVLQGIMK
jgi:hypothetical protein